MRKSPRPRVMRTCQNPDCGKEFSVAPNKADKGYGRFCSIRCSRIGKNNPNFGKTPSPETIEKCRAKTVGRKRTPEVIEHIRAAKMGDKNPNYKPKIIKVCPIDGKEFQTFPCRKNRKFCSLKCRNIARRGENNVMYGKPRSPDTIIKIKNALIGKMVMEKNPRWLGGISFEPYCPAFNDTIKEEIRNKFGRRCFLSGIKENDVKLSVHHCDYLKSQGCKGQRWSLLPLIRRWHGKTNANKWYWFALLRDYWVYKYLNFHGMDVFEGPSRTEWLWEMYDGLNA